MVFPFGKIIFPIALEEPISKTHQFWKESSSMEKFSRDSDISLSFTHVNVTHLSLGLLISKKLRGKDINETLLFFFLKG